MLTTVGEIVHALGLAQGEIGVVGMGQVMVYDDVLALQRALPNARLSDATTAVDSVMAIRSAEEVAMQAESYRAVAQAHARLEQAFRPGRSERTAMAEAVQVLAELGCLDGIAHLTTDIRPFFRPPTDRLISAEEIIKVSLEFAGPSCYWVELSAIYSFREPLSRQLRYYEGCVKAVARLQRVRRPGARGGDGTRTVEASLA